MFGRINRQQHGKRRGTGMRPWLEGLEARVVLSTFKVNTTLDTVAVNLKTGKDAVRAYLIAIGHPGRQCQIEPPTRS